MTDPMTPPAASSSPIGTATNPCIALVGNPNAGKTTLFNALTGLRAKTANFPGTTVEHRSARVILSGKTVDLLDLPGLYSLTATTNEERLAKDALLGLTPGVPKPTIVVLILDATNLERNLFLASQALELGLPTIALLNMVDLAERAGIAIDPDALARELGCPVLPIIARTGVGMDAFRAKLDSMLELAGQHKPMPPTQVRDSSTKGQFKERYDWAEGVGSRVAATDPESRAGQKTEAIDQVLTHPIVGVGAFMFVMVIVFSLIFWIAQYPMDGIDWLFAKAGSLLASVLPDNWTRSLLVEGVIGGVGGLLVFLPQICILFFFLSLLEDTGYLARAAFVMDRLMRRVGLPGKAFVPMLSAHACAIPAIMSARAIEDKRDRLVTILILPLMSCSARIPVYAMVVALLFPHSPLQAAILFTFAYCLGIVAALSMSWLFKRTILKGETRPLVIELPGYKMPSLRNAFHSMVERAMIFVKQAGTVIFIGSVALWLLCHFPVSQPSQQIQDMSQQAATLAEQGHTESAAAMSKQAEHLSGQYLLAHSYAGRFGHMLEPVFRPLGYDWQIAVGVISSFYAREVIVSTLAIVYGVGADASDDNPSSLYETMQNVRRSDGSPVFTTATCASLLVFYVLAMQCISTLAVARRETGSWKWPAFMFGYMTILAYTAAWVTYQVVHSVRAV